MRHSERGTFNTCPFKYKLEKDGVKRACPSLLAEDRTFGIAIHEALKSFYDGKGWEEVITEYAKLYPQDKQYASKAKSYEGGVKLLEAYRAYWSGQDELWEILGTEIEDEVFFNDEEHSLHIDLIARNKQTEEIWAWDHKTTDKAFFKGFWKKYELDAQITRYTKYIKDKYGSCGGFIINALQTGHRERAYKGEPAGYYQRFERQPFSRNDAQIKFWEDSEKDWAELIEVCTQKNIWPKHFGALCGYCDYYELCMSADSPSVRETIYSNETVNIIDETGV